MKPPRCPDCHGPLERRQGRILCRDRRGCGAEPEPHKVLFSCPECGEDAWVLGGVHRGRWKKVGRHMLALDAPIRLHCRHGHRTRIERPELLASYRSTRPRKRRAF